MMTIILQQKWWQVIEKEISQVIFDYEKLHKMYKFIMPF